MIKTYNFSFTGNAPFNYVVNLLSTNIAVDKLSGSTTSTTLSLTFTFKDDEAFSNASATLTLTDAQGCDIEIPINFSSEPCFDLSNISFQQLNATLSFVVSVTGGSGNFEFSWIYDNSIFDTESNSNQQLDLFPKNVIPDEFTVSLIVKDIITQCSSLRTLTVNPCKPLAKNVSVTTQLLNTSTSCSQAILALDVIKCTEDINWESLVITNSTPLKYKNNGDGTIIVYAPYDPKQTTKNYTLTYQVSDVTGVKSNVANIYIKVPPCVVTDVTPIAEDKTTLISTTPSVSDEIVISLSERILPENEINWNSVEVVQTPLFGTTDIGTNRTIVYTVTSVPTGPDTIKWRVKTNQEVWSNIITETLDFRPLAAPVLAPQTVLIRAGDELDVNFVLGATGIISPSSFERLSFDTDLTIIGTSLTRKVKMSAENISANSSIEYKVSNPEGLSSASEFVTIKSMNSGLPRDQEIDLTCLSGNIDLSVYLQYLAAAGGYIFSEVTSESTTPTYTAQGGTITSNKIVNFDAILPGRYRFEVKAYQLAPYASEYMSSFMTIIRNAVDTVPNDTSTGAIDVPYPPLQYSLIDYNNNNCPIRRAATISATPTPSNWTTPYVADMWYKFTVTSSTNLSPYFYLQTNGLGTRLALYNSGLTELYSTDGTTDLATIIPANYSAPLTLGNTYYIRVGTVTAGQFNLIISKNTL